MLNKAEENKKKYLHAPTIQQIDEFVKECKVSYYRFELFFGIARGTIKDVRAGKKEFPVKYWHIIFERNKKIDKRKFKRPYKSRPRKPKAVVNLEVKPNKLNLHSRISLLK